MNVVSQLKKFMEPKSVALIGVSRQTGEGALNILENLLSCNYQGRMCPVNPNASEILGIKTYSAIEEISEEVDLAVINLPRSLVPGAVEECTKKGIKAIMIVTQGFTDADDEKGKQLQKQIDDIAQKSKARILGPNTFGTVNAYANFSTTFFKVEMKKIPVGLICQSGFFFMSPPNLRLGKGIDLGNACDVDFADALEYFEQDGDTKVIALHIEGMQEATRFLEVARRVVCRKPIVALKAGRSEQAAHAAQSHTGSLVGKDEIWDVAFKQCGIIRTDDLDEFADTVRAFSILPLLSGRKIGIVTWSGAVGIISIDACDKFGLELAQLSAATAGRVSSMPPSWQNIHNPVDIWPSIMVSKRPLLQVEAAFVKNLIRDEGVDAILFALASVSPTLSTAAELCQLVEGMTKNYPDKPLVFYSWGSPLNELKDKLEKTGKTLLFTSPDRALRALARLAHYSEFRRRA